MTALHAAPRPCSSCPYATATPPGVWAPEEYGKLARYDDNPGPLELFHCHQENATHVPTICRGWLSVHPDAVAVRIGIAMGLLTIEQRDAVPLVELYPTGTAAADAGLAAVHDPSPQARDLMAKLVHRGAARG